MMTVVLTLGPAGGPGGARILARITRRSWDDLVLGAGQTIFALIKGVALVSPPRPEDESGA